MKSTEGLIDFIVEDVVVYDEEDGTNNTKWFLSVVYSCCDLNGNEFQVHIPKVQLGNLIPKDAIFEQNERFCGVPYKIAKMITADKKEYNLDFEDGIAFYIQKTKDAIKEMTVKEIEKELGYKVKIVNKDE